MIDYLKEMYNKPNYLWTAKDKLICSLIIIFAILIALTIVYCVCLLIEKIKERIRLNREIKGRKENERKTRKRNH